MTLPLFLAEPGAFAGLAPGGSFVLDGDEGRHAGAVRRIRAGETVDVSDGSGVVARCTVAASSKQGLDLLVEALHEVPERSPRLVLVQALAKSGRDEQAVETATEVGVDAVVPWAASRSVVEWRGERGERSRQRWVATARAAAKQSRRPRVPVVEPLVTTSSLASRASGATLLVLHEDASAGLDGVPLPSGGEVLVVVGPEGGITTEEVEALVAAGGHAVRLGPEVLRASTAGPVALAVLSARLGRWG